MSFKNLKVERVEGELAAALTNWYPFHKRGFIKVGQKKWFLPYRYAEDGGAIYEFKIRPDDTWIVTYPRSASICKQMRKTKRNHFLSQIIYVARNPRDVVVSWYHFQKSNTAHLGFQGTFEQFCNNFMNNHTWYSPYWEHVKEAWAMKHKKNMMFLFYEDLIKDLPGNIRKIAAFFEKSYSDEQIATLVEHLKIENFRKNPMVSQPASTNVIRPEMFIRQGMIGRWKEMFTPEIEERFNKWITDNLKDTDLTFPS
ncbi:PREDICTED: sulfotransferase 4A1-like [Wasmannia auropunctata]|uniref:sulfotransferase 4A1-like n=1 Tax=Wasmannia auropunctata TaxID=64793 RepID=UPI0005EEC444|nr:PREDICTED: sulfotransferase 4A1-like [Wasmannia auropunctata]